jgi:hypothetical protein
MIFQPLAGLLYVRFGFGTVCGELEQFRILNNRLPKIFPKLQEILIAQAHIDEDPSYVPPKPAKLARNLELAMKALAGKQKKFCTAYN